MVYGATGSLDFAEIFQAAQSGNVNGWLLKLGVLFIVAAVAFKFGAVPFHMWVPDVYQGAPTSVGAFIGSVPKIAATLFAFRILVSGLVLNKGDWQLLFAALAALSLLVAIGGDYANQCECGCSVFLRCRTWALFCWALWVGRLVFRLPCSTRLFTR